MYSPLVTGNTLESKWEGLGGKDSVLSLWQGFEPMHLIPHAKGSQAKLWDRNM